VNVPPFEGGGGVTGGQGVEILDPRVDGAFLGGLSLARGAWRIDADGVFAAIGGDRAELPRLTVDATLIYGHASVGRSIYKDLYVTAGVRRLALKYDITLVNFDTFTRKPGVWDPLVGLGWHRVGDTLELHASVEGGGFGVGADYDVGASFRVDWKPLSHIGLVGGYSGMIFKVSQDVRSRTLVAKQSLHGPVAGIGLYF
jgi:hypothetical protein